MSNTKYAVYQYGYAIFGIGTTVDEAVADARIYADNVPDDIEQYHGQNIDGAMYIISITDRLYYKVQEVGGSDVPIEHSGYPYAWDIAEDDE